MSTPTKKRRIGGAASVVSPFSPASSNGGSPLGSQKVQVVVPSPKQSLDQLPTPAASSQVEVDGEPGILHLNTLGLLTLICFPTYRNRAKPRAV